MTLYSTKFYKKLEQSSKESKNARRASKRVLYCSYIGNTYNNICVQLICKLYFTTMQAKYYNLKQQTANFPKVRLKYYAWTFHFMQNTLKYNVKKIFKELNFFYLVNKYIQSELKSPFTMYLKYNNSNKNINDNFLYVYR